MSRERNFLLQQGFEDAPAAASCSARYGALLFQPRLIGGIVLAGVLLQEPWIFLPLAAVLWWSALLPRLNPFERLYNAVIVGKPERARLMPAPVPRRFAQAMAGAFALGIGLSLLRGWRTAAFVLEALLLVALAALLFGGFCLGSTVFHLLRGRAAFVRRTLPWAGGD
jgi:hypothetical protein